MEAWVTQSLAVIRAGKLLVKENYSISWSPVSGPRPLLVSQFRIRVRQSTATHRAVPVGKGEMGSAELQGRILVHFGKRVIFYD